MDGGWVAGLTSAICLLLLTMGREVLNDKRVGGSSSTSYWYIDYKYFVDVVQFRLYLMHEQLKDSEQLEIERQTFQCKNPDCGREYTALEVQRLLMPGQYQFHCGHCNEPLVEVCAWTTRPVEASV